MTPGKDYKVSCTNNTNAGQAKATITGKGNYKGTKTLYFKISPKKAVISKLTPAKKKIAVTLSAKAASTGGSTYEIQYRVKGASKWSRKTTTGKSLTITGLKGGKKYEVKVRAYKKVSSTTYNGNWSAGKK